MKYTWKQMEEFFKLYSSDRYSNRTPFCNEMMNKYEISEDESTIMWQAFDMAVEKSFNYNYGLFFSKK